MKTKISILFLALGLLFGCQQNESTNASKIKKGMIKMAIIYPNEVGKTFDMDYYSNKHMPMAADLLGDALKAMAIDKGLGGGGPGTPAPNIAVGYFYFDSMADFQDAMGPNREQIKADVPNYTNIQPIIQISEVVVAE